MIEQAAKDRPDLPPEDLSIRSRIKLTLSSRDKGVYMENSDCQKNQYGHPCFDADAHCSVGRIHLPIAPACNIKCKYCSRNMIAPTKTGRVLPLKLSILMKLSNG